MDMPSIEIECDMLVKAGLLRKRKCAQPATHMVVTYHDERGCNPTGISWAVCQEHSMLQALAYAQRLTELGYALATELGAVCGWCNKPLEHEQEAGSFNCIHN